MQPTRSRVRRRDRARRRPSLHLDSLETRALYSATALVGYDAVTTVATAAGIAPTLGSGVTATNLTRATAGTKPYRVATWSKQAGMFSATPAGDSATTLSGAVAAGQYFQFSISPTAGQSLNVSDVQVAPYLQTGTRTRSGTWAIQYRVDNDGDATNGNGGSWSTSSTYTAPQAATSPALTTVALSGTDDVRGAGIDFRVVVWNGLSWAAASLGGLAGNDVIVDGASYDASTVVPVGESASTGGSTSTTAGGFTLNAPAHLEVTSKLRSVANVLAWLDLSADERGFMIERATDAGFTKNYTMSVVGANVTSYTDTSVTVGTTYFYRVSSLGEIYSSATTNVVQRLTMEKLDPVMYSIGGFNTGGPVRNVETYYSSNPIVSRANTASAFAGLTGAAFIMDNEDGQVAATADSLNYLKETHPGKWVGAYGVTTVSAYGAKYMDMQANGLLLAGIDQDGVYARWDAADAFHAPEREAANILCPCLYLLGKDDSPEQFAWDTAIVKYSVQHARALAPGKPVMPYLTLNTFNQTNSSIEYGPMSLARWTNLMNALKAAKVDAICLYSGGGAWTVPWVATDPADSMKYPGWKPYVTAANQVFNS